MNIRFIEMTKDFLTGIFLSYMFMFVFSSVVEWSFNWDPESWGAGRLLFATFVFWCFAVTFVRFKDGVYDKEDL